MPLYALDTDTLTLLRRRHPDVTRRVAAAPPVDVTVTVITIEEQISGWYTYLRQANNPAAIERAYAELAATVRFLAGFTVLNYTQPAIARFDRLLKQKLQVRAKDLRIAAIALEAGAIVVTANVRDFGRVPGLVIEDWTAPPGP
jgi:tRNA(fMet)-specific endonuclease VapC